MENWLFSKLRPEEEIKFRKWARENYVPGTNIPEIWHPVIRMECEKMNVEQINSFKDED
ncbi:MAG: hypothetical protein M0R17_06365 [Candidatus Omnitrophica bacterium]|jgi:hypothetical protein|nr:hypothetical protein [Candidatus Omnitrophota bacterium]